MLVIPIASSCVNHSAARSADQTGRPFRRGRNNEEKGATFGVYGETIASTQMPLSGELRACIPLPRPPRKR